MKSTKYCSMPCVDGKAFEIPSPSTATRESLNFHRDRDRELYFSVIGNNQPNSHNLPDPKVAIVGLSPADTQLKRFIEIYRATSSLDEAALEAAFEGLQEDIVGMLNGLGVTRYLGLQELPLQTDLNRCGHFLTTSLVKCVSLTLDGSSKDFNPWQYQSNIECIKHRFVSEILNTKYRSLQHVIILGKPAKTVMNEKVQVKGISLHQHLWNQGKVVCYMPHPSGANRESVDLATLMPDAFPAQDEYVNSMWQKYLEKCGEKGKKPQSRETYESIRRSRWKAISELRLAFS